MAQSIYPYIRFALRFALPVQAGRAAPFPDGKGGGRFDKGWGGATARLPKGLPCDPGIREMLPFNSLSRG
jgi:hypothetical protein